MSARFAVDRLRLDDQGYDHTGLYWGPGAPVWRFAQADTDPLDEAQEGFVRAATMREAKQEVRRTFPAASFA